MRCTAPISGIPPMATPPLSYVNGKLVMKSSPFHAADYDVSIEQRLRIGFGQTDYFAGRMSEVRIYDKAVTVSRLRKLASDRPK